jgi:hypothetical protein
VWQTIQSSLQQNSSFPSLTQDGMLTTPAADTHKTLCHICNHRLVQLSVKLFQLHYDCHILTTRGHWHEVSYSSLIKLLWHHSQSSYRSKNLTLCLWHPDWLRVTVETTKFNPLSFKLVSIGEGVVSHCKTMIDCTLRMAKQQITHHSPCSS